jgi:hypothetical protein
MRVAGFGGVPSPGCKSIASTGTTQPNSKQPGKKISNDCFHRVRFINYNTLSNKVKN